MMGTEMLHRLWLEGWRLLDFLDHGHCMGFLQDLQQKGYRFQ